MTEQTEDLKIGMKVVVTKVAYSSCNEDGYPYLDVGNTGTIMQVWGTGELQALYDVKMDADGHGSQWPFWHNELEEVK